MKTLKKNNISQGSSINSPVTVNKNCDLPPFFNTDYFSHVVVQTLEELESIPCKLRQDGMVATVVQEDYSDYQLQTSRTGFGICDNNAWVKISIGDEVFNGGNLFLFQTEEQANEFMGSTQSKEGQIIYISDLDSYFKFDGQDGLTDAFPNKLDKPIEQGVDNPNYKIPAYLDGKPYWRSSSDFEKVKSVNSKIGDVVLKTSDLENDSDYTTNATLTAHTSNKANPHNVTKSQIGLGNVDNTSDLNKPISTATQTELNKKLNKPTTNNTNQFVILGDGSTAPKNDFGKVDTVMRVAADGNKNVDISGVSMNWTNVAQRFSGLANKASDATYNLFPVFDSNRNLAYADSPYQMLKNGLSKMTAVQSLEIAQLLNGGVGSAGTMSVNIISPPIIQNKYNTNEYVVLQGANLYLDNTNYAIEILDSTKTNVLATIPQSQIQLYSSGTQLIFFYNFYQFAEGNYFLRLTSGSKIYITTLNLSVVQEVTNIDINNISWEYIKDDAITKPSTNQANGGYVSLRSAGITSTAFNQSYKSSEIFAEGEDFFIELAITPYSSGTWIDVFYKLYFGIGYSSTPNGLQKNALVHYGRSYGYHFLNDSSANLGDVGIPRSVFLKKVGNLFTISSSSNIINLTLSNNSGYSFFAQAQGISSYVEIQVQILRAFKLNQ